MALTLDPRKLEGVSSNHASHSNRIHPAVEEEEGNGSLGRRVLYDPIQKVATVVNSALDEVAHTINQSFEPVKQKGEEAISYAEKFLNSTNYEVTFTKTDFFWTCISIASFLFDMGSDISTACFLYWDHDTKWWFSLTVAFIVVPNVFINCFSLYWFWNDSQGDPEVSTARNFNIKKRVFSKTYWILRVCLHCIFFGPVVRYIDILYYGAKWQTQSKSQTHNNPIHGPYCEDKHKKNKDVDYSYLLVKEQRDSAMLDFIHSMIQDAPQLILQVYILAYRPTLQVKPANPTPRISDIHVSTALVQAISAVFSLISMSWSVTSYIAALRVYCTDKPNMSMGAMILMFLWRTFTIAARIIVFALFATVHSAILLYAALGHWVLMVFWIFLQKTQFCNEHSERSIKEFLYNMVVGGIYIFTFLNVKETPSRYKMTLYYMIQLAEDVALGVLWFIDKETQALTLWYHIPALPAIYGSFFLGIFFMCLYYKFAHPTKGRDVLNSEESKASFLN
ncbi:unnamed protein product [Darwinula stevensoni]|uniref:XK-related protein n=1 Tax=Darwinula stevensoni TaxID=69355 RepID=A0A7R8XK44_9CRUS|nr:unnamed protein product [Darwinula stevensoni]CAG0894832.1 unnamed protein product [Darwinula stevensoni]